MSPPPATRRASSARGRRPAAGGRRRNAAPTSTARLAVKLCMVVGMLLLIPALWAVAVLIGLDVPMSGGSSMGVSSNGMALLMLVCWPIALMLVGGAYFYGKQHAKYDAKQAAGEEEGGTSEDVVSAGEGI